MAFLSANIGVKNKNFCDFTCDKDFICISHYNQCFSRRNAIHFTFRNALKLEDAAVTLFTLSKMTDDMGYMEHSTIMMQHCLAFHTFRGHNTKRIETCMY